MSPTEKLLLIVLVVLIATYVFFYYYDSTPIHNDGSVEITGKINNSYIPNQPVQNLEAQNYDMSTQYFPNNDYAPDTNNGDYISSSYVNGVRGNTQNIDAEGNSDIDIFFDQNNNVIRNAFMDKPIVSGFDETNGQYGAFFPQKTQCSASDNQNCDPSDLYNPDNYLPQEKIPSWFEPGADPVAVKDRNLVNVSRTMGINTTMGNNKNQSYDIRGGINNPRTLVGPWNQSVIEPGDDYHRLN